MMPRRARAASAAILLIAALVTLWACGGSSSSAGDADFPKVVTLGKGELFPSIANQSLARGENRVSIKLIDRDYTPVLDAAMRLRFYNLTASRPVFRSETDARFIPVELSYVDEQSTSNKRTPSGNNGVYVARANFDVSGDWGVKVIVTRAGRTLDAIPYRFTVLDHSAEPGIGDQAPASIQQTLANATDIEEIDSSYPPRPQMHQLTVADAIASDRPSVVAFATPAFCRSRTCAPVMETVMDPLYAKYAAQANFIHIEPYNLGQLRQANIEDPVRATREWNLQSEPWVFVIDRRGRVAAKFEGIMALDEVEAALVAAGR